MPAAAPTSQKVLGAEVWPQQYTKTGEFAFSYPGNWYLTESGSKILLADAQANAKNTVKITTESLNGKSFKDWLSGSAYKDLKTSQSSTDKNVYTEASGATAFVVGTSKVAVLQATGVKTTTTNMMNIANSFSFAK